MFAEVIQWYWPLALIKTTSKTFYLKMCKLLEIYPKQVEAVTARQEGFIDLQYSGRMLLLTTNFRFLSVKQFYKL